MTTTDAAYTIDMNRAMGTEAEVLIRTDDGYEVVSVPIDGCFDAAQEIANERGRAVVLYRRPTSTPQTIRPTS